MNIVSSFINTFMVSVLELIYLVGIFILIGFILGFLEKLSNTFLVRAFGPQGVLLTAWIGTPIHELGHLIQCFIWGHRVTRVKLLQLNHPNGVLGYVEHQYNLNSVYQRVGNFFIGLGPIFSGIGSLIGGMYLLVPQSYATFKVEIHQNISLERLDLNVIKTIWGAVFAIVKSLFTLHNFINPAFWIFLLIAISISSHIGLSKADIQNSVSGLVMIFFLVFFVNIGAGFLHINAYSMVVKIADYNAYVLAFSSIAVLFSLITLGISFFLYKMKQVEIIRD
jgi:hypothetical protein